MIEAKLIGERSAGMTAVQIYNTEELVWSHYYFSEGCGESGYKEGLRQAFDDMKDCKNYTEYDGNDLDESGDPIDYYGDDQEFLALSFCNKTWKIENNNLDGQTSDFIKYNLDRLPEEIINLYKFYNDL